MKRAPVLSRTISGEHVSARRSPYWPASGEGKTAAAGRSGRRTELVRRQPLVARDFVLLLTTFGQLVALDDVSSVAPLVVRFKVRMMFRVCASALVVVALAACERAPNSSPFARPVSDLAKTPEIQIPAPPTRRTARPRQADAAWPVPVMQDEDPRVRRFALEQWARNPTESLDLVGAAMVDPDESIRERAAQIFDEALARRR